MNSDSVQFCRKCKSVRGTSGATVVENPTNDNPHGHTIKDWGAFTGDNAAKEGDKTGDSAIYEKTERDGWGQKTKSTSPEFLERQRRWCRYFASPHAMIACFQLVVLANQSELYVFFLTRARYPTL